MLKYFAYGSNCNPKILQIKGVGFFSRQRAVLQGYRLLFNKKSLREKLPDSIGFANIIEDPEGNVEGILYEINSKHLQSLDKSERYPNHYQRLTIVVQTDMGPEQCWAYKANPDKLASGLVPTRDYLNHILAARDFFSQEYFDALKRIQTYTGKVI